MHAAPASSFSAWQLGAFASTLNPTVEATLKKGLSAGVGIPVGGLAGLAFVLLSDMVVDAQLSVRLTVEVVIFSSLFVFTAVAAWLQPIPGSTFRLDGLADLKVAIQVGSKP